MTEPQQKSAPPGRFFAVCPKSFAEFAARQGGEQFESFFAATCAWQKILCAERVFFRPCMGGKARVEAIPDFVKKDIAFFDKLKKIARQTLTILSAIGILSSTYGAVSSLR